MFILIELYPNQSRAALEWLTYRESLLPKEGGGERIKHARNGGEKSLRTSKGQECVDGWYKNGNTELERVDPLEPREAKPTLRVPLMVIIVFQFTVHLVMTLIIALTVQGFPKVKGNKCHLPILPMVPKG